MRRLVSVIPIVLTAAALGCSDDSESPLAPPAEPAAPSEIAASAAAAASWQPRADYPTNLYEAVSAAYTNPTTLKTTLYVIGGAIKQGGPPGSLTDAVRAYDVATNTWSTKA